MIFFKSNCYQIGIKIWTQIENEDRLSKCTSIDPLYLNYFIADPRPTLLYIYQRLRLNHEKLMYFGLCLWTLNYLLLLHFKKPTNESQADFQAIWTLGFKAARKVFKSSACFKCRSIPNGRWCAYIVLYTDSTKINRPGHNIRITVVPQKIYFEVIEICYCPSWAKHF